jgi:prolyl 4-hydroxylase
MSGPTLAELERAAAAGNVAAMTDLGTRLLSGSDGTLVPQQGADWLATAAERGSGEACARVAVLAGAGVCRPQSWDAALDYLQRSAELGWEPAQKELALLALDQAPTGTRNAVASGAPGDWQRAREAVDVTAWTAFPPKQSLSESPRIRRIEKFASKAVCDWLIERTRGKLHRARTYDVQTGEGVVEESRTNTETDFNIVEADLVLTLLRARIAAATGLPPAVMELTKVLHYYVGQRFAPHFDFIDPAIPGLAAEVNARGQRLVTFLVYLNDDYDGGATDFPAIRLRNRGRRGDALMFANVDLAGLPDRNTLHEGMPPTRGEKWLLSQWIRDRIPAAQSSAPGA